MKTISLILTLIVLSIISSSSLSAQPLPRPEECSPTEAWVGVGAGLPYTVATMAVIDNHLHALCVEPKPERCTCEVVLHIMRWNDSRWSERTSFTSREANSSWIAGLSMTEYHGDIYVKGDSREFNIPTLGWIMRWDGVTWSEVKDDRPNALDYRPLTGPMAVYNDELYSAAGQVLRPGVDGEHAILAWNGAGWRRVSQPGQWWDTMEVTAFQEWRGELFVTGTISQIDGIKANGMYRWDGSRWAAAGSAFFKRGGSFVIYRDELYAFRQNFQDVAGDYLLRWDGAEWQPTGAFALEEGGGWNDMVVKPSIAVHDDEIYATWYEYRRTTPWALWRAARWNGSRSLRIATIAAGEYLDSRLSFIESDGTLYAGGAISSACGLKLSNVAQLCQGDNCGAGIQGTIYDDLNGNCLRDPNEPGLRRRVVEITPGPFYAATDDSGRYRHFLPEGAYDIAISPRPYWQQSCSPTIEGVTILGSDTRTTTRDVAFTRTASLPFTRADLAAGPARPGRLMSYTISYENIGTIPTDGTIRFFHDPRLIFNSSSPSAKSHGGLMAEWTFTDLKPDEQRSITIRMEVPRDARVGEELCSRVEIDPSAAGVELRDSACVTVRTSYDPNMVEVSPGADRKDGAIYPSDTVLTYTIHFQNTGHDTAFKVVVVDSLDSRIDPRTITLGAASHPFTFSMSENALLRWTFDDIMLPDSGANEPNSHGYLKYSAHLRRNLPLGTRIPNRAAIYFDYNWPVATNKAISTTAPFPTESGVDDGVMVESIALHPNPARGLVYLTAEMAPGARVAVMNALGQTLRSFSHDGSGRMELNVADLPAGAYWIAIPTTKGMKVERVTVVR